MLFDQTIDVFDALRISATGFLVVIVDLALLAVLVFLLSKIVQAALRFSENRKTAGVPAAVPITQTVATPATPVANALPPNRSNGELELIRTDEATAAVVMAIVSEKTDIPLNRLNFIRIEQLEEDRP